MTKTSESDDIAYARYCLLKQVSESVDWLTPEVLLSFLEAETTWGRLGSTETRKIELERWLEDLRNTHVATNVIEVRERTIKSKRKHKPDYIQLEYRQGVAANHGNVDEACLDLLSASLIEKLLSADFMGDGMAVRANLAERKLAAYEAEHSLNPLALKGYRDRICVVSRGQQLHGRQPPSREYAATISLAILQRKCIDAVYNGRRRTLHPFGLVFREPKLYLLAVDEETLQANGKKGKPKAATKRAPTTADIRQFLVHRFEQIAVSPTRNRVPDKFSASEFVADGGLDIRLPGKLLSGENRFDLTLRVLSTNSDNLRRDLEEFPLAPEQTLVREADSEHYELTVPGQSATIALIEWIVGRLGRVEVIEPLELREYIGHEIASMHGLYAQPTNSAKQAIRKNNVLPLAVTPTDMPHTPTPTASVPLLRVLGRSALVSSDDSNQMLHRILARTLHCADLSMVGDNRDFQVILSRITVSKKSRAQLSKPTEIRTALEQVLESTSEVEYQEEDSFTLNTRAIAGLLGLNKLELDVLRFAFLYWAHPMIEDAFEQVVRSMNMHQVAELVAKVLEKNVDEVSVALGQYSTLRNSGLLKVRKTRYVASSAGDLFVVPPALLDEIFIRQPSPEAIVQSLFTPLGKAGLTADDFEHVGDELNLLTRYLKGALQSGTTGANILLWGPPGAGKTELARLLVSSVSQHAFEVRTVSEAGNPLDTENRLDAYRLCQSVFAKRNDTVLVYDEVEDLLSSLSYLNSGFQSDDDDITLTKGFMNQLLENNAVPAIWITNTTSGVDAAYLRRFDLAIKITRPKKSARKRLARRILGKLPVEGVLLEDILKRQPVSPAHIAKGARVIDLVGAVGDKDVNDTMRMTIKGDLRAVGAKGPKKSKTLTRLASAKKSTAALPFDSSVINADQDIHNLEDSLQNSAGARICLYGPPGTGKTAWSRNLAKQLGKKVHVVQGADIFGMYVGETEKAIAKAFKKAAKKNAVLVFDEVDSFLQDRLWAKQQYEIKFVNQFLLSMENYNGLLVCTTNLMAGLDKATLRRFDWKIKFDYLREEQIAQLFESLLNLVGLDLDDPEVNRQVIEANNALSNRLITPGDFAVVLRKSAVQMNRVGVVELVNDLLSECQFREDAPSRGMGFNALL